MIQRRSDQEGAMWCNASARKVLLNWWRDEDRFDADRRSVGRSRSECHHRRYRPHQRHQSAAPWTRKFFSFRFFAFLPLPLFCFSSFFPFLFFAPFCFRRYSAFCFLASVLLLFLCLCSFLAPLFCASLIFLFFLLSAFSAVLLLLFLFVSICLSLACVFAALLRPAPLSLSLHVSFPFSFFC